MEVISEKDCYEIVRKSLKFLPSDVDDVCICSHKVIPASNELVGYMGEYYALRVRLRDNWQAKSEAEKILWYFVKYVPIDSELLRSECERKGFFIKEAKIYTDILSNVQRFASTKLYPECYFVRHDLIVLEDLFSSKEHFRHMSNDEQYSMVYYKVVLKHLAKLHVASIVWELDAGINIGEQFKDILFEVELTMENEWYVTGIKGLLSLAKRHPKFQDAKAKHFVESKLYDILAVATKLAEPSQKFRNVLCHRDTWDKNIFYRFDTNGNPIDCRLVDFQLASYSPPAIDVLFFLYITASKRKREETIDEFLDFYHKALRNAFRRANLPEDTISKAELLASCEEVRLVVLILRAICLPFTQIPKGILDKMRTDEPERFDYYMNSDREELFIRIMENGYKELILESVAEVLEYLLQRS